MTVEDFDAFLDNVDASVIAAFPSSEITDPNAVLPEGWDEEEDGPWEAPTIEHPVLTSVKAVSAAAYGYRFAHTSAPELLEKLKVKKSGLFLYRSPKFMSTKDGDRPRERFPSDTLSESAVTNWLAAKAQPLVGLYNHNTKDRYKSAVALVFLNLDFEKQSKNIEYVLKRARKVAASLKGKKLAIAVASSTDMSYELGDYGLKSKSANEILMGIKSGSDYYSAVSFFEGSGSSSAFSGKSLSSFADAFLAGKLTPYEKPEEPPPADDEMPLDDEAPTDEEDGGKEEM